MLSKASSTSVNNLNLKYCLVCFNLDYHEKFSTLNIKIKEKYFNKIVDYFNNDSFSELLNTFKV